MGERRKLMETMMLRKKRRIGHVLREESMLREVMERKMVEKRGRGRRRVGMLQKLYDGEAYGAMKRRAEDRIKRRLDAKNLPKGRNTMLHTVIMFRYGHDDDLNKTLLSR